MSLKIRSGRWHIVFMLHGRRYSRSTGLAATGPNRSAALKREQDDRQALLEGRTPARIRLRTFTDAAREFMEWAQGEYREHPNTWKRISGSLTSAKLFFGKKTVSAIDEGQIDKYKTWRRQQGVKEVTIRHDLHALSGLFQFSVRQHWTCSNPIERVDIPSDRDAMRMHVLTDAEEKAYFAAAARRNMDLHDLGRLMILQGCRPEELRCLQTDDVNLERGKLTIRQGKTAAARRTLTLVDESKAILARRMAAADEIGSRWIFPSRRNASHIGNHQRAHDELCREAGVSFVLYDLRHSFATRLAQAGCDLPTLAAILGHASIRLVQRYVHIQADHMERAMRQYGARLSAEQEQRRVN
jgi:site-specific recombinase XerD